MGVDVLIAKGWTRCADGMMRPPRTGKCPDSGRMVTDRAQRVGPGGAPVVICWECGRELTAKLRGGPQGCYVYPNHQRSR